MHPVFQFLLATFLFMLIHVSVMALCARAFGITIRRIAYGVGPTLLSIGKAQVKLLPFAGSVVLKDTREEDIYDHDRGSDIYNERPLWQQLAVLLSGVAAPLILALGLLGTQGWSIFTAAFPQIIAGALAPLSTAQQLLADGEAFAAAHGFALLAALVSVKLCALNLLPFGGLNGGQALLALARGGKPYVAWEETVAKWLLLPGLAVLLAWLVAFGVYCWKAAGA